MLTLLALLGVREGIALRIPTHKFRWAEAGAPRGKRSGKSFCRSHCRFDCDWHNGEESRLWRRSTRSSSSALFIQIGRLRSHRAVGNSVALSGGVLIMLAVAAGFTTISSQRTCRLY
jgi:hypothetical protein